MSGHILAIDQATTSWRAIVFDKKRRIAGLGQRKFARSWALERRFTPAMAEATRQRKYAGWADAVRRTLTR